MKQLVLLALSSLILATANAEPLPNSKFYNVGVGATFIFNKSLPLEIERPYKAYLFFQRGNAVAENELIKGEPYCFFWATILSYGHREIQKGDSFSVNEIKRTGNINLPDPFYILDFHSVPAHWPDGAINSLWCFDRSGKEEASYKEMLNIFGADISVSFPN